MPRLKLGELADLGLELGLLAKVRVTSGGLLDRGVSDQLWVVGGGLVRAVERGSHDLADKPGLALDPLPLLDAAGSFHDVGVDADVLVLVALPNDSTFPLFDVGWLVGAGQVVKR